MDRVSPESRLRRFALTAVACTAVAVHAPAQDERGHVALRQAILDATNDRMVAIVAPHPDDQWMLPAAYLRFRLGFRVAVILFTRGEGGQNKTGPEVGDALGRIRTLETEASAKVLDCDIWYLNRTDAGFCRSGQEALELWGKRGSTEDLARILRKIQPDVVLTTHGPTDNHGHDHGLLAVLPEAVELAMSPSFRADNLPPVRIHRLFRGAAPGNPDLSLPADTVDFERGITYRQIAYSAFAKHESQRPHRSIDSLFEPEVKLVSLPLNGRRAVRNLQTGTPSLFTMVRDRHLRDRLENLSDLDGNRRQLQQSALELRKRLLKIGANAQGEKLLRVQRRLDALDRVIQHAIALQASVEVQPGAVAVPGESVSIVVRAHFEIDSVSDVAIESLTGGTLQVESSARTVSSARFAASLRVPENLLRLAGDSFRADTYERPIRIGLRYSLPGIRERLLLPLEVPIQARPPVELEVFPPAVLMPDGVQSAVFAVRVHRNTQDPIDELLTVRTGLGVTTTPISHRVRMAGETLREYQFRLTTPVGSSTMMLRIRLGRWTADLPLHRVSVRIDPDLRVGLIRGVDDTSRSILRGLGVDLVELTPTVLPTRELDDLDSIVVDIRALAAHSAAKAGFNRLIDYVRDGGRLVVLYHKDQEFNLESSGFRGFPSELPLHIGKGRVTREDQPVEVLIPDHPLLNVPNRIRSKDWDGWVQERGLYFPDEYSESYDELLRMSDPGEPHERGSLLYGRAGSGEFVYCALSLYRQLKRVNPGACRLFANLVSRPTR